MSAARAETQPGAAASEERTVPVLYVVLGRYAGGAEEYVARLAESAGAPFAPAVAASEPAVRAALARRLAPSGVTVAAVERPRLSAPASLASFAAFVRRSGARLVHVNLPSADDASGHLAAVLARAAGARVVTTIHLADIPWSARRRAALRVLSRAAARVVTVCEANRRALETRGVAPSRVSVVLNGTPLVDGPAASRRDSREEIVVLAIGALDERKDPLFLLDAFEDAAREEPRLSLVLAGGGPLETAVAARAARVPGGRARLVGHTESLGARLAGADVVVSSSRLEGLPFAVLEAMAAGRPVVATAVNGVPEAVVDGETGVLVRSGDRAALAAALVRLARDPELRERLGRAGRRRVAERFSAERMARDTEAVYRAVLGLA